MDFLNIVVIAVALAMDAFAVSVVSGSAYKKLQVKHALRMALFFGLFQACMPLVGALAGLTIREFIAGWDHWFAFFLLAAVGAKMIYESFKIRPEKRNLNPASLPVLFALALATSIDALVVGVTLPLLVAGFVLAVTVIGIVTFVLSYLGVYIGKKLGHFFESRIEALGGIILIGLGAKILLQHLLS
jgi:putative Mn2+ efflux pump MntP